MRYIIIQTGDRTSKSSFQICNRKHHYPTVGNWARNDSSTFSLIVWPSCAFGSSVTPYHSAPSNRYWNSSGHGLTSSLCASEKFTQQNNTIINKTSFEIHDRLLAMIFTIMRSLKVLVNEAHTLYTRYGICIRVGFSIHTKVHINWSSLWHTLNSLSII